ncbi:MAG TPA: DUF1016 N-terminal domain-containing protein, partial [Candidatus Rifleibacterium sp.]|nr:DUF1016 N-terminal domain-containing protein [Candidatus Rifleibacterium sp.]
EYKNWLLELKQKFRQAQLKAAVRVNSALLEFYWELGASIVGKQKNVTWGSGFLKQFSIDLMVEFPDVKGFSEANLHYIRRLYLFYVQGVSNSGTSRATISKQLEQVRRWHLFCYEKISIAKQPASQL